MAPAYDPHAVSLLALDLYLQACLPLLVFQKAYGAVHRALVDLFEPTFVYAVLQPPHRYLA